MAEIKQNQGFTIIPDKMVEELGVSEAYFLARLVRWKEYNSRNTFQLYDNIICKECGVSKRTIKNYQASLKEKGYIKCYSNKRPDNTYDPMTYWLNTEKINTLYSTDKFRVEKDPETEQKEAIRKLNKLFQHFKDDIGKGKWSEDFLKFMTEKEKITVDFDLVKEEYNNFKETLE